MTSFRCKTCGGQWNEGPTRDHRVDQDCRLCVCNNELIAEVERASRYEDALNKIANMDYRGNRSTEATIAFHALNPEGNL